MKKFLVGLIIVTFALSVTLIGSDTRASQGIPEGPDGKPIGCFCCVKDTCVVTKNEADCKKIGGAKVEKCDACGKAAKTK